MAKDKCGACHYFETDACDLKPRKAKDQACGDFYRKRETKKPKPIKKASGIALEGAFEAIFHNDEPAFLVKTEKGFEIKDTVTNASKMVVPLERKQFPYEPYGYSLGKIPSREDLFWRVRDEFAFFLDCEEKDRDLFAACCLLSYQQEKLRTTPYLYFVGDNETGKTVALSIFSMLCYRPLYGVTIPSADLYGFLDDPDCIGTILEDEAQGLDKNKDFDKLKIYKSGYKAGACVPRYRIEKMEIAIRFYQTFCFKAVASENLPVLKGLVERFIIIPMVEGYPKRDWADINDEDLNRLRKLRNDLLKWRLASRTEWKIPNVEVPIKGRLKELWKPLLQVVSGLPIEQHLRDRLVSLKRSRIEEKQNTLEGHIVSVALHLFTNDKTPLPASHIWEALKTDLKGVTDKTKDYKMHTAEFDEVTKNKVGRRLREVLLAERGTFRVDKDTTVKAWVFKRKKLERVARKYGYKWFLERLDQHTKKEESVTELPKKPISEGIGKPKTTLEKHGKEQVLIPLENGSIGNTVTTVRELDPKDCHVGKCGNCQRVEVLCFYVEDIEGNWCDVCKDCGELFKEIVAKRGAN